MILCKECPTVLNEDHCELGEESGQFELKVTCPKCGYTKYIFISYDEMIEQK